MAKTTSYLAKPDLARARQEFHLIRLSHGPFFKLLFVGVTLVLELALLTGIWDCRFPPDSFAGVVTEWYRRIGRCSASFAIILPTLFGLKNRKEVRSFCNSLPNDPIRWTLLAVHFLAIWIYASCSLFLCRGGKGIGVDILAFARPVIGAFAVLLIAVSVMPIKTWTSMLHSAGSLSIYSLLLAIFSGLAGSAGRSMWQVGDHLSAQLSRATFLCVETLLQRCVPHVITDPAQMLIGTPEFQVTIASSCSGFEGMGLILVFGIAWLTLFRREYAFPQALLIVPAGVVIMFLTNAVRITALILIGNAGAERIAVGGFHSQAGWICFNILALVLSAASSQLPWVGANRTENAQNSGIWAENATAAYLLPFLAVLAVGMISQAMAADFDWLYPTRFVAAIVVLGLFRRNYRSLDWSFGWTAAVTGIIVFVIWMALSPRANDQPHMPAALQAASGLRRATWIAARIVAAVTTCPIVEELAFRGFLIRHLIRADFESISTKTFSWLGLALSSIIFGALHGRQWLAGSIAGLLYALALIRKGRIGDAVVAHAITNALLAGYVLMYHRYDLW